ncbi:hypothetical protein DFH06DRAFT_1247643 [Mycena polygramma]|nr:hypothetical protein DFH06DRAFT_1247643 [Mycena polygramma]
MNPTFDAFLALERRLQEFSTDPHAIEVDSDGHRVFLGFLTEACDLVRSRNPQDSGYGDVVDKANEILGQAVALAYAKLELDFLQSFAHSAEYPLLTGPHTDENTFSHRRGVIVLDLFEMWMKRGTMKRDGPGPMPHLPPSWKTTPRPHMLSSLLSRFDVGGHDHTTPLLSAIYDARCEITSDSINQPIGLTNDGSCVLLPSMGGWKNRSPILAYYLLDDTSSGTQFPLKARYADVGLTEVAWHAATDEPKKLMFVADNWRVKSYTWADEGSGEVYEKGRPTHTLDTGSHHGPLHTLAPGLLIRAGKGSVGVWDLGALPTHGPNGRARIGRRFDTSNSWRDEDDKLEASSGSDPTSTITLADSQLAPEQWHAHPTFSGTMLCGMDTKGSYDYSCVSLDLEHGGKTVARYLGHGGNTRAFSTSAVDPTVFLTAASDGHARLYDHRMVLPVLSLRAGTGGDDCMGVVLTHPDGIPTIFTGAARDQIIRLWDVRAQKMVYELSTGNSAVVGMTWDAPRSTLYVATQCDNMNRLGDNFDYRHVKRPRISWSWESLEREDSDGYDSEDEWDDDGPCWPKNAGNAEDYFGHLFDAGDHRLFCYAFKDQPDPSILPEYGEARVYNDGSW